MSEKDRILQLLPADGWFFERRSGLELGVDDTAERIVCWALMERPEGSRYIEAMVPKSSPDFHARVEPVNKQGEPPESVL